MIYVGAEDPRIKAIVSQVPGMGQPAELITEDVVAATVTPVSTRMARGEIDSIPRPPEQPEALAGIGDFAAMLRYSPRAMAKRIRVPILIIDQEDEEYGGRENSGLAAYEAVKDNTICAYHVFDGTHYEVYEKNYKASADLARDWFVEHLMPH